MNYLVVIDTNVLISALLSKHSDAATVQVLNAVFDGTIIPVFNDEILAEYDNVLHRPKFKFSDTNIQLLLDTIKTYGVFAKQLITNEILPDPKDLVFYEVVMAKQDENAYLVTGNMPADKFVCNPKTPASLR